MKVKIVMYDHELLHTLQKGVGKEITTSYKNYHAVDIGELYFLNSHSHKNDRVLSL